MGQLSLSLFSLMAFSDQTLLVLQAASSYPGRRSRDAPGPPWPRFVGRDRTRGFSPEKIKKFGVLVINLSGDLTT